MNTCTTGFDSTMGKQDCVPRLLWGRVSCSGWRSPDLTHHPHLLLELGWQSQRRCCQQQAEVTAAAPAAADVLLVVPQPVALTAFVRLAWELEPQWPHPAAVLAWL